MGKLFTELFREPVKNPGEFPYDKLLIVRKRQKVSLTRLSFGVAFVSTIGLYLYANISSFISNGHTTLVDVPLNMVGLMLILAGLKGYQKTKQEEEI